jgi:deoxyribodipyrimidine photo-lyase
LDTAIWWIRRDLRLNDNQALTEAASSVDLVIPVFVLDPKLIDSQKASSQRLAFLYKGLAQLDADLRARGSKLVIRKGAPLETLVTLVKESGAKRLFAEADFSPYARNRDEQVAGELPLKLMGGPGASHPEAVLKSDGKPYVVYSPYMRAWKSHYQFHADRLLTAPESIQTPLNITSESLLEAELLGSGINFEAGEAAANKKLIDFTSGAGAGIYQYADLRNRLDIDGTAQLSPYLRFGMISARQCFFAAQEAIRRAPDEQSKHSAEIWLNELIWREFYISILYHFPSVFRSSFREDLKAIPWRNDASEFSAWCEGSTGYPVVDAAMRQLLKTGWMHNRARMIVASFLVKDLLVDWRWGEKFFMEHLIDGDPAANNGGWQWTAGTGTDAAPYFRVFNPILQGKKFDPQGNFIHNWIPELAGVATKFIHTPWGMPEELQLQAGCVIGKDYPQPIVEHSFARERALEVYNQARQFYQPQA